MTAAKASRPYRIIVADNFRYQDKDAEYEIEGGETAEEALTTCKLIVDQSLDEVAAPGMTASDIFGRYQMFGEDPYIIPPCDEQLRFSAWDYAEERATVFVRPAGVEDPPAPRRAPTKNGASS